MRIGVSICPEPGRWRETVRQARLVEELGLDSVWIPEHHLTDAYYPSPLLALAGLATALPRVTLGSDVALAPLYNPVRLAEESAMLQEISDGRFVLGLGLGYVREEFDAYNVPFSQRGARLEEAIRLLRLLWTQEEASYRGRFWNLQGVTIYPRPDPPPPLWLGGWTEPAIRRAARLADAWFPGPTADMDKLKHCLAVYDDELARLGKRRQELPVFREVWVADSPAHLEAGLRALRSMYDHHYRAWGHANVAAETDVVQGRAIVGGPEGVAEQLVALARELGVTHVVARTHFYHADGALVERAIVLLGRQVKPAVDKELRRG
jgi:probable F420-dependent oxidoreductase